MPLKAELEAIKKNYVKLMKLPVKDLLPALKVADVVSDDQREQMNTMTLDKERAGYLIDKVIIATLKVDIKEPFLNFLQVLEDDDNPVVKVVAKDLRAQVGSSAASRPPPGHQFYGGPNPGQPPPGQQFYGGPNPAVQPYPAQPYPGQPLPGQQFYNGPYPSQPYPSQPYPSQPYPYPGQQPYSAANPPGQQFYSEPNPPYPVQSYPPQPNPGQPYSSQPNEGITSERVLNQGKGGGYIDQAMLYDCMKSVCMIQNKKSKGTGIIGRLKIKGTTEYVLLTCNHVIPTEEDAKSALFYFGYTDEAKVPVAHKACNILNTTGEWFWSDPAHYDEGTQTMGYNYTMMKVSRAELDKITFVEKNETMKILGVPLAGGEHVRLGDGDNYTLISQTPSMKVANGRCTEHPSDAVVKYGISTSKESAGGPVFKEDSNKPQLIAIHNGSLTTKGAKENYGVRLSEILKHWCKIQHPSGKAVSPSQKLHPMPLDARIYKLE